MTWRAILKLDFRDTVFGYDRDMAKLKADLNELLSYMKDTYSIMLDDSDAPTIEEAKKIVPNIVEEFKQQISLIMSHLDEIKNEQDKDKRIKLMNEIVSDDFKGTGELPPYAVSAIMHYLGPVYNETFTKSFKETVFNTDRDLIEFKRELQDIKQDEDERDQKILNSSKSLPSLQDASFREKKRLLMTIEHIEDYLNNHLRQYPVLNEQQKIGVVDWFTKDSIMNALKRYKTRYIRKLANFLYDKYGATIPTSTLDKLNITERAFIPLEKSFKETVFANEGGNRELRKLKEELNVLLSFVKENYQNMLFNEADERRKAREKGGEFDEDGNYYSYADGEKEPPSMKAEDIYAAVPNIVEEFEQQISLIIPELEAIDREEDNNKQLELIDDIIYPLDFKGTGKLPSGAAIAIVEYLEERYTQKNTQQAKKIKQKLNLR